MPSFEIEQETITVEFEVFCGVCNEGLCRESDTRQSRGRGAFQVTVNPCPECLEEACENGREELREELYLHQIRIKELEEELDKVLTKASEATTKE